MSLKNKLYGFDTNALLNFVLITLFFVSLVMFLVSQYGNSEKQCKSEDVYILVEDWSDCTQSGIKTRVYEKVPDENLDCVNSESVQEPKKIDTCTYVPICLDRDIKLGPWSTCIDGKKQRTVTYSNNCVLSKEDELSRKYTDEDTCDPTNSVRLLRNYTTQVEPEKDNHYLLNYRNLKIVTKGNFSKVRLIAEVDTSVLDGRPYKIPGEYYYFMFALDENVASALDTSRISIEPSRIDVSDRGVINGSEMPAKIDFDLSNIRLSKSKDEGIGFYEKNYLSFFSENNDRELDITLFVANGQSMTTVDPLDRIFATIKYATIEYECAENSDCKIERIPELK